MNKIEMLEIMKESLIEEVSNCIGYCISEAQQNIEERYPVCDKSNCAFSKLSSYAEYYYSDYKCYDEVVVKICDDDGASGMGMVIVKNAECDEQIILFRHTYGQNGGDECMFELINKPLDMKEYLQIKKVYAILVKILN